MSSSVAISGYTWSADDTIRFDRWVSTVPDGHGIGDGYWSPLAITSTSGPQVGSWFGAGLHGWSVTTTFAPALWDDNSLAGAQLYLRARSSNHSRNLMTFDQTTDPISCLYQTSDWVEYESECRSERSSTFRIETQDFVPFVDQGKVDCPHDGNGCTQCMPDVVGSVRNLFRGAAWETGNYLAQQLSYQLGTTVINHTGGLGGNHIQGLARFPNWENSFGLLNGRTVLTRDQPSELYLFSELQGPDPELDSTSASVQQVVSLSPGTDLQHAGGIFAAGDLLAVPIECLSGECDWSDHNEIVFFRLEDWTLTEVNRLSFPSPQGAGDQQQGQFAQSVAFTRLRGGKFLLFIADYGASGGVFYVSKDEQIRPSTQWTLLNEWIPGQRGDGSITPPCNSTGPTCYGGAASAAMFTQCDGGVFVLAFSGESDGGISDTESWVNIFEVQQNHATGLVYLDQVDRRYVRDEGQVGLDERSYHFAGTVFLSSRDTLIGQATEWDFNNDNNAISERLFECSEDPLCP